MYYPGFYNPFFGIYSGSLRKALVLPTRADARILADEDEIVRKVELTKAGKAKRVIGQE